MSDQLKDPIGQAILDFSDKGIAEDIIVRSDICDDDVIPVAYLFRSYEEMPQLEKVALSQCSGRVLEVGPAAGMHAEHLIEKGLDVETIDISEGAVKYLKSQNIPATCIDFFDYNETGFDTVLMLMNGIGIAKNLEHLEATLIKAKQLLNENGKILCDSSDIKYLYEDDEGGMWVDLSAAYYGNFRFQMKYEAHESDWFEWLYVDFDNLKSAAERAGFSARQLYVEDDQYLAELTLL